MLPAVMGHRARCLLAAATALLLLAAVRLPDPREGVINGRAAMMVWPRHGKTLLEPDRCVAHFVRRDGSDSELLFPCGVWIQPPSAQYWVWLEQRDLITPMRDLVVWFGGAFTGRGMVSVFDLVAGGHVQLAPGIDMSPGQRLELVHLDSHRRLGVMGRLFTRLIPASGARDRVLMPAGRIVAGITDAKGNVVALSPPVAVPERATIPVSPQRPKSGTDVFVALVRARIHTPAQPDDVTLALRTEGGSRAPDVLITAADRIYAVWYAVDARRAVFQVAGQTVGLPPEDLQLRPGTVVTLRRTLKLLPRVNVSISAPDGAGTNEKTFVDVTSADGRKLRRVDMQSAAATIDHLPAEVVRLSLTIGKWTSAREVDLSGFEDQDVTFELEPIVVGGTVYHGRQPVPAKLKFYVAPDWVETETDDRGNYEITLWEPRTYPVEIQVRDDRTPPFREYFVSLLQSQTRDFHVPDGSPGVRVVDARSGAAIPGAEVVALNTFRDDEQREQTALQRTTTDADGRAWLPPLRPGSAGIVARATSYRSSEPVVIPIRGGGDGQPLEIRLERERDTTGLTLVLSNGQPAAAAAVIAVDDSRDTIAWQSAAGSDGTTQIPASLDGSIVVVKHPAAAAVARRWTAADAPVTWQLPDRAPPLLIKVMDVRGDAVISADIVVWADGIPLRGTALRVAADSPSRTDRFGLWRAANFSAQTLEVLAMRRYQPAPPAALAQRVETPRPDTIVIRVVE